MSAGWIGVDLDGTLAHYDGWQGPHHIGAPITRMVERVQSWIITGHTVKIFTARVCNGDAQGCRPVIEAWCLKHIGVALPVTHEKDFAMIELWDDRAVQVVPNTGIRIGKACRE